MKKFLIVLIGLLFFSGFNFAQGQLVSGVIYAHESQEQIEPWRDNQQLTKAREMLLAQIALIRNFTLSVGEKSDTVSKLEIELFRKMIERFFNLREELLETIDSPYFILTKNDALEVTFMFECKEITEIYFSDNLWYGDNSNTQIIKKFFRKYTGKQMEIEKSKNWGDRVLLGFILGAFLGLVVMMIFSEITYEDKWIVASGITMFVSIFIIFLWVL